MKFKLFKTFWDRVREVFGENVEKELKQAKLLKEFADKYKIPVIIEVPSLKIRLKYDPLEREKKEKAIELMKLLIKEKKMKLQGKNKLLEELFQ